jgi:hypothetical protein
MIGMVNETPELKKEVFKAVQSIYSARQTSSRLPVTKVEISVYTGIYKNIVNQMLTWLSKHGLVVQKAKGYIPNKVDPNKICWKHGKLNENDCQLCKKAKRVNEERQRRLLKIYEQFKDENTRTTKDGRTIVVVSDDTRIWHLEQTDKRINVTLISDKGGAESTRTRAR